MSYSDDSIEVQPTSFFLNKSSTSQQSVSSEPLQWSGALPLCLRLAIRKECQVAWQMMSRWVHRFCSPKWKNETVERKERRDLFCYFFWWVWGFMFYVNCSLAWFSLYQAEIGNKLTRPILHIEAETSSSMKQHRQTQNLKKIGGQRNIMIVIYNHCLFWRICMHTYICQLRIMKRVIGYPNISYICRVSGPWKVGESSDSSYLWLLGCSLDGWWDGFRMMVMGGAPGAPQKTSCYPHQKRFGGNLLLDVVKDWLVQGRWNTWIHKIIQWVFFTLGVWIQ